MQTQIKCSGITAGRKVYMMHKPTESGLVRLFVHDSPGKQSREIDSAQQVTASGEVVYLAWRGQAYKSFAALRRAFVAAL